MSSTQAPSEEILACKWMDHCTALIEEQQQLFYNSAACDCVLISGDGKRIGAHQVVLSTASAFFGRILAEHPAHIEPSIHIADADEPLVSALLTFIYTGETSIASGQLEAMVELCHTLDIRGVTLDDIQMRGVTASKSIASPIVSKVESIERIETIIFEESNADEAESTEIQYELIEASGDIDYDDVEYLEEDDDPLDGRDAARSEDSAAGDDFEADNDEEFTFEIDSIEDEVAASPPPHPGPTKQKRPGQRSTNAQIDIALNEATKSKTIHRLSVEYNVPRSTLYHRFRSNERLRKNYRIERKCALEQAVRSVLDENLSLMKASERFKVPKTAIWRRVRQFEEYNPVANKEVPKERQDAQEEIMTGKSLTSISAKYGIPLTTLHRDKKKLSSEGKLPEPFRVRDRTENSEYSQRLEEALQKCRQGMSQYQAAKLYKIPKATMWRYAHTLVRADKKVQEAAMKRDADKSAA